MGMWPRHAAYIVVVVRDRGGAALRVVEVSVWVRIRCIGRGMGARSEKRVRWGKDACAGERSTSEGEWMPWVLGSSVVAEAGRSTDVGCKSGTDSGRSAHGGEDDEAPLRTRIEVRTGLPVNKRPTAVGRSGG
jgi:hypothetical protein